MTGMQDLKKNMSAAAVATVLCLLLSACLAIRPPVISGVLHGDLLWQGEVLVAGDVILAEDVRLIIQPGTRVRFLPPSAGPGGLVEHPHFPGSELIVKGRLHAVGTPGQPIVFESVDPYAVPGSWGAINLEGSAESVFEYCLFRQADSAIHSRDSQVYIENSIFLNNLVGVRFHDSEILIERNLFESNATGVRFHFGAPVICENEFRDNDVNLFVTSEPRDYRIENNSFGVARDYQVVLGELVPDDVRIPGNYWVVTPGRTLAESVYDGRRSDYLGKVRYDPVRTTPSTQAGPTWSR